MPPESCVVNYWLISRFFSSSTVSLKIWLSVIFSPVICSTKTSACDTDPTNAAFNWSVACLIPTKTASRNSERTMWVVLVRQIVEQFFYFVDFLSQRCSNKIEIADSIAQDLKSVFCYFFLLCYLYLSDQRVTKAHIFLFWALNRILPPNLSTNSMLCKVVGGYQQGCHHPNTNYAVLDLVILFQLL